ncbi:MAG: radical SAM family heme chaperone HemW [Saprospirales bacterium]|nr:radical SAM family heme chaperone HemW [Saprospirales bacterium]
MAGIYLHIPFCKQACSYCNFHFSTLIIHKNDVLKAMLHEIELQHNFFPTSTKIETIYFGGGTPSLLSVDEINTFTDKIKTIFDVVEHAEITLEANPDDITNDYLVQLKNKTSINRLSIGVQSFLEEDLLYMNRAHNAQEAIDCIRLAKQHGFHNLSVDLIYGTPSLSDEQWHKNLDILVDLDIAHVSCYALTVEEKTALHHSIKTKKISAPNDEKTARQFSILMDKMQQHKYTHYEISNFCKEPHFAKHNTNYWKGISYLGIGPSAHSFDGFKRYWNIANNAIYTKKILNNEFANESEVLSKTDSYNEYVMTSIRTVFGVDLSKIKQDFGDDFQHHFLFEISPFIDNKWIVNTNEIYTLTNSGKLFCDYITTHLFIENE